MKTFSVLLTGLLLCCAVPADTHYVDINNATPAAPYTNWVTAATTIQDAVDAASSNDTVLVNDGIYDSGVREVDSMNNRIAITEAIRVESVNGPKHTIIMGAGPLGPAAIRCAVVYAGGELCGFTLTNGHTRSMGTAPEIYGGGISGGGSISNCSVTGNSASYAGGGMAVGAAYHCIFTDNSANFGGGMCAANAYHCVFTGNLAVYDGGGLIDSRADNCIFHDNIAYQGGGGIALALAVNCTITDNSAFSGGGSYNSMLKNCIVFYNTASSSGDNWYDATPDFSSSCTTPDPGGTGNITHPPLFAGSADYHLQAGSPCIDSGIAIAEINDDHDGTPRPLDGDNNGTALHDMGAYEFTSDAVDTDGDGISDFGEFVADTGILDSNDWFRITGISVSPPISIHFSSSDRRQYTLLYCDAFTEGAWKNVPGQTGIMGCGGQDSLCDLSGTNPACFYRVEVGIP